MSRSWNGESLVNELSALLGDTSDAFKARVLGWLNDTIFDISSRHDWGFHLVKGKKILAADEEIQSLEVAVADAPDVALQAGGSLTENASYTFLVTFTQDNGVETKAGEVSGAVTCTSTDKSIHLTNIPSSQESLITGRKVYMAKDDGSFYLAATIDNPYDTTLDIDADTTSEVEPPDYESIRRLKGSPFFESDGSNYLTYKDIDQLRLLIQGQWASGNPEYFSPVENNSISTYPIPASDMEVSFNYYRYPFKLYDSADSQPDLPVYLKPALKAGVIALGYEYRDRDGQEVKRANYENALFDAINRGGRVANIEYTVRDVYGGLNGFEVS